MPRIFRLHHVTGRTRPAAASASLLAAACMLAWVAAPRAGAEELPSPDRPSAGDERVARQVIEEAISQAAQAGSPPAAATAGPKPAADANGRPPTGC